jgi:hypothetical protein
MGRSCPDHEIPQFDCMDCRSIALRQAAYDGRIELASTVLGTHWSRMSSWY